MPSPERKGNEFLDTRFSPPRTIATILPDGSDVKLVSPYDQIKGADRHTLLGAMEYQLRPRTLPATPEKPATKETTAQVKPESEPAAVAEAESEGEEIELDPEILAHAKEVVSGKLQHWVCT